MSKNKICIACGFEDFEDNINNFCCNCGKDIDTGLTLEEMDKQGINYLIDKRTNEYRNSIIKHNDLDCKQKDQRIAELEKENEQLKQQLAEKDKLLEKENKALEIACKKIEDLRFENADICDYEYNEIKTEIRIKLLLEEAEEALKKLNKE